MFGSDPYHAVKSGRVGAMLQSGGLMPEVTVRELVTLVTGLHPKPEPVEATLKRAGIDSSRTSGWTGCPAARPSGCGSRWPSAASPS